MNIRPATSDDLGGIMRVEVEAFGIVGACTVATEDLMRQRLDALTANQGKWFLVAINNSEIVGYIILQPTNMSPDDCTSWENSTDNGTMRSTLTRDGKTIFGVSIAVATDAPATTVCMLLHEVMITLIREQRDNFIFCLRIPGMKEAIDNGVAPEAYWISRRTDGLPENWLIRECYLDLGILPRRLLKDGYSVDRESAGYAALVVVDEPLNALRALAERINNLAEQSSNVVDE